MVSIIGSLLDFSKYRKKLIFGVFILLIITLIIDTVISRIYDIIRIHARPYWTVAVWSLIVIISVTAGFILIWSAKTRTTGVQRKPPTSITLTYNAVSVVQWCIAGIMICICSQLILYSYFNTVLVFLSVTISYSVAIFTMTMLSVRFFLWFRGDKNSVILFYSLSSLVIAINAIVTLSLLVVLFPGLPSQIGQSQIASLTRPVAASVYATFFNNSSLILSIFSFVLMWTATALLLRNYSKRIGVLRFWIFFTIPLIYFLSQFPTLSFNIIGILMSSNPAFFGLSLIAIILFALTKPTGGIIFALAFWKVSTKFDEPTPLRDYLMLSGSGIVLLFISSQGGTVMIQSGAQYPPFGVASTAIMGLSSYLLFLGIFSSALSVAQDSSLRKSIRKSMEEQLSLLGRIGTAQMNRDIEKRVAMIARRQADELVEQSGIETSLEEEDIKDYITEVFEELKKQKN
jgi:hypothetical protein